MPKFNSGQLTRTYVRIIQTYCPSIYWQDYRQSRFLAKKHACKRVHKQTQSKNFLVKKLTEIAFFYQNVRGLRTKCTQFLLSVYSCSSDIIVITESGLDDSFHNDVVFPRSFSVNRCDRSKDNSNKDRLGGVIIAIKKVFKPSEVDLSNFSDIEICCSRIDLTASSKLYVVCVYIPPRSQPSVVTRYLDAFRFIEACLTASDKIYIFGDFNHPKIKWVSADADCTFLSPSNTLSGSESDIVDTLQSLGLLQVNRIRNHQDRTLDLIFTNNSDDSFVSRSLAPLVPEDLYHPSLYLFSNFYIYKLNIPDSFKFDFKRANYVSICDELKNYDWYPFLSLEINDLCSEFYRVIKEIIFKYVPVVRVRNSSVGSCPWDNEITRFFKNSKE